MEKKWYKSKTLWINIIALAALFLKNQFGFEVSAEETGAVLAVVNLILRAITKTGLSL